ncbi:MAG: PQQ-dependent sugar dehydrogenase [Pseudomonadales bacterium]
MDLTQSPLAPEVYAHGVRNTVGFTWEPATGDLWFTDNGRDWMGDELPPCELNHAPRAGLHFGYPFIHGNAISDPEFGAGQSPADYVAPALELGAHVAPLGLMFYDGDMLPPSLHGAILIAEHGSWNRTPEAGHVGYRITTAIRDEQGKLWNRSLNRPS